MKLIARFAGVACELILCFLPDERINSYSGGQVKTTAVINRKRPPATIIIFFMRRVGMIGYYSAHTLGARLAELNLKLFAVRLLLRATTTSVVSCAAR